MYNPPNEVSINSRVQVKGACWSTDHPSGLPYNLRFFFFSHKLLHSKNPKHRSSDISFFNALLTQEITLVQNGHNHPALLQSFGFY